MSLPKILLGTMLILTLALVGCGLNRDGIAKGLPNPDTAFSNGFPSGDLVFIWDCFQGKRIAIYRSYSELSADPYQRQEVACGELTPIEKSMPLNERRPQDPKTFWNPQ